MAARLPVNLPFPSLRVQSLSLQMQRAEAEEHFSKPRSAPRQDWELHTAGRVCPVVHALFTTRNTSFRWGEDVFIFTPGTALFFSSVDCLPDGLFLQIWHFDIDIVTPMAD